MIDFADLATEKAAIVQAFQDAQAELQRRQALTDEEQVADTIPPPAPTMPAPPSKTCGCGAEHDAYEWLQLSRVGVMRDSVEALELRNCAACDSTISVPICVVDGCTERALWAAEDGMHCHLHDLARHREVTDDRRDFADEYHRDHQREWR